MGYDVRIRRNKENRISVKEWHTYIASDPEFQLISEFSPTIGETNYTISTPDCGLWKSESLEVPFTFNEGRGEITVKNPDQRIINKMIQIADTLHANVLGEEGEQYSKDFPTSDFAKRTYDEERASSKKWWQLFRKSKPLKPNQNNETKTNHVKTFAYDRMISANFYYEKNSNSFTALLEFLKKIENNNTIDIVDSIYHVEDFGISGTIKEIELDKEFKVGVILHTKISAEHIMIVVNPHSYSVLISIFDDAKKVEELIKLIGNESNFLLGSIYNSYDCKWQSETDIKAYQFAKRKHDHFKFAINKFQSKCIDTSSHYGRQIHGGGLSFVVGWKNYFGTKILRYLPQEFWTSQVYINSSFDLNGILTTQLYEDIFVEEFEEKIRPKQKEILITLSIEKVLEQFEKKKFKEDFEW